MIMTDICPHCGKQQDDPWDATTTQPFEWVAPEVVAYKSERNCEHCGRHYIISEEYRMSSHLVARDDDQLDKLIHAEGIVERIYPVRENPALTLLKENNEDFLFDYGKLGKVEVSKTRGHYHVVY